MQRFLSGLLFLCCLTIYGQRRLYNFQSNGLECIEALNKSFSDRNWNAPLITKKPLSRSGNDFYSLQLDTTIDKKLLALLHSVPCIYNVEEVPKTTLAEEIVPNDTLYPFQWSLPFVHAEQAWSVRNQKDTVLIGIVDSGTDFYHPDLQNYFRNSADTINGIDDDANGFEDDYTGWDFGDEDNNPQIAEGIGLDHGVQMTSLAAAPTDNFHGIASPGRVVKYLPVKITNAQGVIGDPYEGVAYAIEMGCDIINCSWTQGVITNYGKSVIALAKEKDILIVGAAGNFNSTAATYPCAHPDVLCVAAVDENGDKTFSSSYGEWIDIASPGINLWAARANLNYGTSGGTSGACAFTSGAVAWLSSVFPNESSEAIKTRLLRGVQEHEQALSEFSGLMGEGLLNMYRAQELGTGKFSEFTVWPNPSSGDIHIQFRLNEVEPYTMYLFDLMGRELVKEKLKNLQLGENRLNFNFQVNTGAYYLILKAENSIFLQEIFIGN